MVLIVFGDLYCSGKHCILQSQLELEENKEMVTEVVWCLLITPSFISHSGYDSRKFSCHWNYKEVLRM